MEEQFYAEVMAELHQQEEATMKQISAADIPSFDDLADSAFIRIAQLTQNPKRAQRPAPLPFSAPTLWRRVKDGSFPKPVKLSLRVTAWRVSDVRAWIAAQTNA
jgi:prophage regulatory protein